MNLNIGSGIWPKQENWIRMDHPSRDYPDLTRYIDLDHNLMEMKKFPFDDKTFDLVYCRHVFEHLPDDVVFFTMKEVYRCLKPTGGFRIITPDMVYDFFKRLILHRCNDYGKPYDSGNAWRHINYFYYWKIRKMLQMAGFTVVYRSRPQDSKFTRMHGDLFDKDPSVSQLFVECKKVVSIMSPSIKKTKRFCRVCGHKMDFIDGGRVKFYECPYCDYIPEDEKEEKKEI